MQVLFCHDGPLRVDTNGNYYGIAHNDEMFERYHIIADKVATAIRLNPVQKQENIDNLSKISISPSYIIFRRSFSPIIPYRFAY